MIQRFKDHSLEKQVFISFSLASTLVLITALCLILGLDIKRQQDTVDQLRHIPEIVECHYITGSFNLLAKLYCLDNAHLMDTIYNKVLQVPGVSETETTISLIEAFSREIYIDILQD